MALIVFGLRPLDSEDHRRKLHDLREAREIYRGRGDHSQALRIEAEIEHARRVFRRSRDLVA